MRNLFKVFGCLLFLIAALALAGTRYSLIRVTNQTGKALTNVSVSGAGGPLEISTGPLAPSQTRWYVRRAGGSCGCLVTSWEGARRFFSIGGIFTSDQHGHLIRIALQPDMSFRFSATPEAIVTSPPTIPQ